MEPHHNMCLVYLMKIAVETGLVRGQCWSFQAISSGCTCSVVLRHLVRCLYLNLYLKMLILSRQDDSACEDLFNRNCLRRIARNDDTESSPHSVMNVIEKFVKTVNVMDETILVPCRLMDLKVGDEQDPASDKHKNKYAVQQTLKATDLFEIYSMLKNVKDGLLWGGKAQSVQDIPETSMVSVLPIKGHIRRPSTVSVGSTNSSTSAMSDSDSETGSCNENDSGIEEVVPEECRTERIAHDFQRHLMGLTRSLKDMTEAAQYLTWRYQHDIGGPV